MPNTELLKKTLAHIEAHPETWDQGTWCGTAQCFAGHAVALAGIPADPVNATINFADIPASLVRAAEDYVDETDVTIDVRAMAIIALGIEDAMVTDDTGCQGWAASMLFDAINTLDDLRGYVAELCGETAEAGPQ